MSELQNSENFSHNVKNFSSPRAQQATMPEAIPPEATMPVRCTPMVKKVRFGIKEVHFMVKKQRP